MYRKRRNRKHKRKQKGKGLLLGSDWPKIRKNLLPYLRKRKKLGRGAEWDAFKKSWNSVFF